MVQLQTPSNELRTRTLYNELSALAFSLETNYIDIDIKFFYMICIGKTKQHRQIPGVPGFFGCSGYPGYSGESWRSGVPVFLVSVHA